MTLKSLVVALSIFLLTNGVQSNEFTNLAHWMTDFVKHHTAAADMPFNHWMLPGTHDAGAYEPLYGRSTDRIVDWNSPQDLTTRSFGFQNFYKNELTNPKERTVAQHIDIVGQLNMGARYLDLRFKKPLTGSAPLVTAHNVFEFFSIDTVIESLKAFKRDSVARSCEIVWLRIKIESEIDPSVALAQAEKFLTLNNLQTKSRLHNWFNNANPFTAPTYTTEQILRMSKPNPNYGSLTYRNLCQNHDGVIYMIVFASDSLADTTAKLILQLKGNAIFEENVIKGPAAQRLHLKSVLDTQIDVVKGQADAVQDWYVKANQNRVPNPVYTFDHFRRVYLTSTGGKGTNIANNLNIFLNSHGIWKFALPTAVKAIQRIDLLTTWYKIDEPAKNLDHYTSNPVILKEQIKPANAAQEIDGNKSAALEELTLERWNQWTRENGYLDRSHTHIVMIDFCELTCPTVVYYSTLVMKSRLRNRK